MGRKIIKDLNIEYFPNISGDRIFASITPIRNITNDDKKVITEEINATLEKLRFIVLFFLMVNN